MVDYVIEKADNAISKGETHHMYVAIADWLIMGLQSGSLPAKWDSIGCVAPPGP